MILFNLFEASKYLQTYYAGQKLITKISDKLDKKRGDIEAYRSESVCQLLHGSNTILIKVPGIGGHSELLHAIFKKWVLK